MSKCISREGEYSEHLYEGETFGSEFICTRCLAFDEEAADAEVKRLRTLIGELVDPDLCWFDHNGGCQAHGYLHIKPGEICPMAEAQKVAALIGDSE